MKMLIALLCFALGISVVKMASLKDTALPATQKRTKEERDSLYEQKEKEEEEARLEKIKNSCKSNEEFLECQPTCPVICDKNDKSRMICTFDCNTGCFCKDGYIRNSAGECVVGSECP